MSDYLQDGGLQKSSLEIQRLNSFARWPSWAPVGSTRLAAAGFSYAGCNDEVFCESCAGRLSGWKPGDDPLLKHKQHFPECPFVQANAANRYQQGFDTPDSGRLTRVSQFDPRNAMKDENARLQTYINWSRDAPVSARDLAAAGFYFTGTADMVKCAFCGGMIRNFEPGDTAMGEHKRHFPACSFVKERLNREGQQSLNNTDDDPIIVDRPKHPHYATRQAREKTFERWPTNKTQKPDDLVNAGFFYAKFNDNVKCFFCNGGLRNWEPGDDPWTEHARWFPKCGYVRQCKGVQFIRNVAEGKENPEVLVTIVNSVPGQDNKNAPPPPPPNPLEDAMKKTYAQSVKDMYPEHMIRYAIKQKLDRDGVDFPNAPSLLEAIYKIEDDGIDTEGLAEVEEGAVAASGTATSANHAAELEDQIKNLALENEESEPEEDPELLEETRQLLTENRKLKIQKICKVCNRDEVCVLLLPCAHLVVCESCAGGLRDCPVCGCGIRGTVKTYLV